VVGVVRAVPVVFECCGSFLKDCSTALWTEDVVP